MAAYYFLRFAQLLKKGLPSRRVRTNTLLVVSAQVVLMAELIDLEPLAKRLRVGTSAPASPPSFLQGPSFCSKSKDNEPVDEEKSESNTEMKTDLQPKTADGGLRRAKQNAPHQRLGPGQQQKLVNTLEEWLVKPTNNPNTPGVCQTEDDDDDDGAFQSTSAQFVHCQDAGKPTDSDMDEETQPLTPQDLEEDSPVSPASEHSAVSGPTQTLRRNDDGLEEREMEMETSVRHNTKITDFYSGTSSPRLPVRRVKPDESQDADEETPSADVKWLGTPISELKRMPECGRPLPPLRDVPGQHTVMIRV